ncbi:MAG: hypothetical protein HW380_3920 [Magnetococcales bacterium]|nr:hypothetical protein [Magnetococcales bacterium]
MSIRKLPGEFLISETLDEVIANQATLETYVKVVSLLEKGDRLAIISGEGDSVIWGKKELLDSIKNALSKLEDILIVFLVGPILAIPEEKLVPWLDFSKEFPGKFLLLGAMTREPVHGFGLCPKDSRLNIDNLWLFKQKYHKPLERRASRSFRMTNLDGRSNACTFMHSYGINIEKGSDTLLGLLRGDAKSLFDEIKSRKLPIDHMTSENLEVLINEKKLPFKKIDIRKEIGAAAEKIRQSKIVEFREFIRGIEEALCPRASGV